MSSKQLREFFIKRFNRTPEQDPDYFDDWERRLWHDRYHPGYLAIFMDDESKKVWAEVTKHGTTNN